MGNLVVMVYPTKLFLKLADHTYVKCGTGGKAWGCWGGRTGGTELRRGVGSTSRADAIAGADERGGIKCYLINGVCHQAANRILFAAGITVRGARGYDVSEALFGTYGRTTGPLGTCRSPFNQHAGVSGDLPACVQPAPAKAAARPLSARAAEAASAERKYLRGVLGIYAKAERRLQSAAAPAPAAAGRAAAPERWLPESELEGFEARLFMHKAQFQLGAQLDKTMSGRLEHVRRSAGRSLMKVQDWFTSGEMSAKEFVAAFNDETLLFQESAANMMKPSQYKALFGLAPGDFVTLADPRIVSRAFGKA